MQCTVKYACAPLEEQYKSLQACEVPVAARVHPVASKHHCCWWSLWGLYSLLCQVSLRLLSEIEAVNVPGFTVWS
jgi:hypothetical protein